MLNFTFNPLAEEEYGAAVERSAAGQGDVHLRFIETFEAAILQVRQFPESGPVARGSIRSKVLSGFPYTIYYSIRPPLLRILAVAHHSRQPFYWLGRHRSVTQKEETVIPKRRGSIKLLDTVALLEDVPERKLKRGEVGTVVEILAPHVYDGGVLR